MVNKNLLNFMSTQFSGNIQKETRKDIVQEEVQPGGISEFHWTIFI